MRNNMHWEASATPAWVSVYDILNKSKLNLWLEAMPTDVQPEAETQIQSILGQVTSPAHFRSS